MLAAACLLGGAAPQKATYPQVSGFSAYLLDSRTGKLSGDMIGHDDELGNVPAGPLSAVSSLVVVRVAFGANAAVPVGQHVRFVATSAGGRGGAKQILLDRTVKLGPVADDGSSHVGFWLDGIGCAPLTLRATLVPGSATKQAELPFSCYE
jgi:hypothetical protein